MAELMQAAVQLTFTALLCVYQLAWLADRSLVKVWEKSRRIGASWVEALYSVLEAAKPKSKGGQNTYYLSYNKDMTRQFVKDCSWWARIIGAVVGDIEEIISDFDKDVTIFRITFSNGNVIEGLPSESRSIRSKQGRVILDEAAFVEDLDDLLKAAMAMIMWGGQVVILSTHYGADNKFNELLSKIRAGEFDYSLHRTTLDDALSGGLYKSICRKLDREWSEDAETEWRAGLIRQYGDNADEELFCIPNRSSGAYLTTAMIEACMEVLPVITWTPPAEDFVDWPLPVAETYTRGWIEENLAFRLGDLPEDRAHFCGVDFGRSGDLSVFWPATEEKDLRLVPPFVLELRNCPHRTQQQILFAILDALPRFSGVSLDARGNGSALAEACRQEYGPAQVLEVMISESWYRETMPLLKAGIEDKTLILPKDAGILSDFRSLRVVKGVARVPDKRGKDKTGGRHGDTVIACAMMLDARKELGSAEPWDYVGVPMQGMDLKGW